VISIEEFAKVQLCVGLVESAEPVPGSRKLVAMRVDLGEERRTLVAGIGRRYRPEELVGKSIIVVANLEPATLAGVTSQGMILAASQGEGKEEELSLLTLDRPLPPGSRIR
jgi:methionine--tRNA ligase beta chain